MHILPVLDFLTGGVAEQRSVETITAYGIDSGAMKKKVSRICMPTNNTHPPPSPTTRFGAKGKPRTWKKDDAVYISY